MNDASLLKKTKNTFLLIIGLFILAVVLSILFITNIIGILIGELSIKLFGYIVSLIIGIVISIYSIIKTIKLYKVDNSIALSLYQVQEVKIGKNGLLVFVYSIYLFAFSIIQLISGISDFKMVFFIHAIAVLILSILYVFIGIIILRLSGKYYKENKDETAL